jgi:hypothetical protein
VACAAGRSVCLGLAKRGHRSAERALRDELVGSGLDGLVRAVFAGRGVQLLEVALSASLFALSVTSTGDVNKSSEGEREMTTPASSPANALPDWVEGRRRTERLDTYRRMRKFRRYGVIPPLATAGRQPAPYPCRS